MHALRNSFVITFGSIAIYFAVLRYLCSKSGTMLIRRLLTSLPGKIITGQLLTRIPSSAPLAPIMGDPVESLFFGIWGFGAAVFSAVIGWILAYLVLRVS